MKKKIVSALVAGALVFNSAIPVFATPSNQEVTDARSKYAELEKNLNSIQDKIDDLNVKIDPLVQKVENNKKEIADTKKQIENTQKEVEQTKVKIADQEEVLGGRLRELYKSGGQASYLSLLFGAESFSDLIGRMDSANRLVELDKNVVEDLVNDQNNLNNKVKSLQEKSKKIEDLNAETEKELSNFEKLKAEQEKLAVQANEEQKKFDAEYLSKIERQIVSPQISILKDNSKSVSEIEGALTQLNSIKNGQLKSPTVIDEVNKAIEDGKVLLNKKKEEAKRAQEEARRAQENANRGGGSYSGGSSNGGASKPNAPTVSGSSQAILNEAYKHLGKRYVWGATGPDTFDCSGFTSYVYRVAAGASIGRTTYDQIGSGRAVSQSQLQPGDLVFTHAGHVGIYVGGGSMIHAPRTGDVIKVSPVWKFYAARRILN